MEKISVTSKKESKTPIINGRNIIKLFLKSEIEILLNISLTAFRYNLKIKLDPGFKNKNFSRSFFLDFDLLKSLLLLTLSLIQKSQADDNFFYEGRKFKSILKNILKDNPENFVARVFPDAVTGRQKEFVEKILREYMKAQKPVSVFISDLLSMNRTKFKTQALLFLTGILYREDKNE
ncbi:hypothetical protein DRN73_06110 [Candidatus Pacearchaeota archaeon]|nr:MAG: hypothetical protein DRN73_06110 [Candidatus Pacearchaeota archaeon]